METADASTRTGAGAIALPAVDRALRMAALGTVLWCFAVVVMQSKSSTVETIFFKQDVLWLLFVAAFLFLSSMMPGLRGANRWMTLGRSRRSEAALAVAVVLVALLGARLVFHNYAMSLDEAMVGFDATIFRHGRLLAPVPESWRPYTAALEPRFILPVAGHAAWVSSYLPINAAVRAILDGIPGLEIPGLELASALLAGVSILAAAGVARRLWPDRPDAALVAAILLATSSQFLVTAFTPYAMTAHLAFNLVWLWFFLRQDRLGHAGAIATAALACGLHQLIFHPLFALPFILQLAVMRRWRLAALYTGAYAAIGLFWICYWQLMLGHEGLRNAGGAYLGVAGFAAQVLDLLHAFSWSGLDLMAKNLTRFLAWQNPLALALAPVALFALRRIDQPLAALAAGLLLTIAAMFIILPYQGLGWGYRYLHGFLGSFCLLAAYGWIVVTRGATAEGIARVATRFSFAGLFCGAAMLPGRALEANAFVAPYAEAERAIKSIPADIVIVDPNGMGFATDLVRNDPFLRNRPLVMDINSLEPSQIRSLCASYKVALFDRRNGARFHMIAAQIEPDSPAALALRSPDCGG